MKTANKTINGLYLKECRARFTNEDFSNRKNKTNYHDKQHVKTAANNTNTLREPEIYSSKLI